MQLHPEFIERMEKELGDQAAAFFSTYKEESWVGLRANVRKGYVSGFEGVPWCPSGSYVPKGVRMGKDPLHAAGAYYMQEPSAMAPVEAMCWPRRDSSTQRSSMYSSFRSVSTVLSA